MTDPQPVAEPLSDADVIDLISLASYGSSASDMENIQLLGRALLSAREQLAQAPTSSSVYLAIAHGDEEHRGWLSEALDNIFAGKPVPEPRGKNTDWKQRAEAAEAACAVLLSAIREFDEFHNAPTSSRPSLWFKDILANPSPGETLRERDA